MAFMVEIAMDDNDTRPDVRGGRKHFRHWPRGECKPR